MLTDRLKRFNGIISSLIILCMFALLLPLPNQYVLADGGAVVLPANTLLTNGGFEQWDTQAVKPSGYGIAGSHVLSQDVTDKKEGNYSLKVALSSANSSTIQIQQWGVAVTGGERYKGEIWAKTENANIKLALRNSFNAGSNAVQQKVVTLGTGWQKIEYEYTAPAEAASTVFEIVLFNGVGNVWLDGASLMLVQPEPEPEPEQPNSALLTNGGFEQWDTQAVKPSGYGIAGSHVLSQDVTDKKEGNYSLKVALSSANSSTIQIQQWGVAVTGGERYKGEIWAKTENANIKLALRNSFNAGSNAVQQKVVTLGTSWQKIEYEYTAPAEAASTVFEIVLFNGVGNVWLDGASLTLVQPEPEPEESDPQGALLTNGGFNRWSNSNLDNWEFNLQQGASKQRETTSKQEGSSALSIVLPSASATSQAVQWWVPVDVNKEYKMQVKAAANNAGMRVALRATLFTNNSNGSFISDTTLRVQQAFYTVVTDWDTYEAVFKTTSDTQYMTVELVTYFAAGTMLLDGAELTLLGNAVVDNGIIKNGGFEQKQGNQPQLWSFSDFESGAVGSLDATETYDGNQSYKVTLADESQKYVLQQWYVPVAENDQYMFGIAVKAEDEGTIVNIRYTYYDSNRQYIGVTENMYAGGSSDGWRLTQERLQIPTGASLFTIEIIISGGTGQVWLDAVALDLATFNDYGITDETWKMVDLGIVDYDSSILQTAMVTLEDGPTYLYAGAYSTNGGRVGLIDVDAGTLVRYYDLPEASGSWGMALGADGLVYVSTIMTTPGGHSKLYRFDPTDISKEAEYLGDVGVAENYTWDIQPGVNADGDIGIYGGTYPGGKLFFYNIEEDRFEQLGTAIPGSEYARGVAVGSNGLVIVSLGMPAKVAVYDSVSGEWLTKNGSRNFLPEQYASYSFSLNVNVLGDKAYVHLTSNSLGDQYLVYDLNDIYEDPIETNINIGNKPVTVGNEVYYPSFTSLRKADLANDTSTLVKEKLFGDNKTWLSAIGVYEKNEEQIIYGISNLGFLFRYNLDQETSDYRKLTIPGYGLGIFAMDRLEDELYLGTYMSGNLNSYNMATGERVSYGRPTAGTAEIYSFAQYNNKLYMGTYTGAEISVYDPAGPWNPGSEPQSNPRMIGTLDKSQYRPISSILAPNNLIYFGSAPDYGVKGGAISSLDPETEEIKLLFKLPGTKEEDFTAVVYQDGAIYAGTSLGKLYMYDIATEQVSTYGNLYGGFITTIKANPLRDEVYIATQSGKVFVYDTATDEISSSYKIPQAQQARSLALTEDGNELYIVYQNSIWRADLATGVLYKLLDEGVGMLSSSYYNTVYLDPHGDLYFGANENLKVATKRLTDKAGLSSEIVSARALYEQVPQQYPEAERLAFNAAIEAAVVLHSDVDSLQARINGEQQKLHKAADAYRASKIVPAGQGEVVPVGQSGVVPVGQSGVVPVGQTEVVGTAVKENVFTITAQQLLPAEDGRISLILPDRGGEMHLPIDVVKLTGGQPLYVKIGAFSLQIPAKLLEAAASSAGGQDQSGRTIALLVELVEEKEYGQLLQSNQTANLSLYALKVPAYRLAVAVVNADGSSQEVLQFAESLKLAVTLPEGEVSRLVGLYRLTGENKLTYVGVARSGNMLQGTADGKGIFLAVEYVKNFDDLPAVHWSFQATQQLSAMQIVNGTSEALFNPARNITRAEFVALLARALKLEESDEPVVYGDVSATAWYAGPVAAALKANLVQGVGTDKFAPDQSITREEMAVLLMRAYGFSGAVRNESEDSAILSKQLSDYNEISLWAREQTVEALQLGLLSGVSKTRFAPATDLTRAEAAQAVFNLLQKI